MYLFHGKILTPSALGFRFISSSKGTNSDFDSCNFSFAIAEIPSAQIFIFLVSFPFANIFPGTTIMSPCETSLSICHTFKETCFRVDDAMSCAIVCHALCFNASRTTALTVGFVLFLTRCFIFVRLNSCIFLCAHQSI